MNAVRLDCVGNSYQVFVDHRHDCNMMFGSEVNENLAELIDVVGPIVWRQCDSCKQHFDACALERSEDEIEVAASLIEREPAQPIIAAEFNDDDIGMK